MEVLVEARAWTLMPHAAPPCWHSAGHCRQTFWTVCVDTACDELPCPLAALTIAVPREDAAQVAVRQQLAV